MENNIISRRQLLEGGTLLRTNRNAIAVPLPIRIGCLTNFNNDHEMLAQGMVLYDAV